MKGILGIKDVITRIKIQLKSWNVKLRKSPRKQKKKMGQKIEQMIIPGISTPNFNDI